MNNIETLKLALEALETLNSGDTYKTHNAATALRQAIEQAQEQKPVGQLCEETYGRGQVMWFNKPVDGSYVYTSPPPRQWVGLTDEQIGVIATQSQDGISPLDDTLRFARAIEAVHGIKGEV